MSTSQAPGTPTQQASWPAAAAPPAVPSRAVTIVVTVLFGLFGLIPAYLHGKRAEQLGVSSRRYWVAFGVSLAVSAVAYIGLVVAVLAFVVSSAGPTGEGNSALAASEAGWSDAPEVGSCYMGSREEAEAFGGVVPGGRGPGYAPIDCSERSAFFVVSGVVDGITRDAGDPPACESFGPVYTVVWYDQQGRPETGPLSGIGSLVCLRER